MNTFHGLISALTCRRAGGRGKQALKNKFWCNKHGTRSHKPLITTYLKSSEQDGAICGSLTTVGQLAVCVLPDALHPYDALSTSPLAAADVTSIHMEQPSNSAHQL